MFEIQLTEVVPSSLLDAFNDEAVTQVIQTVANGARAEWIRLAGSQLHSSRADYISGIQPVVYKPGIAVLSLVGQPANLIEHGSPAVDLREWLLGPRVPVAPFGSKGKRRAKDGSYYRAVPFRHGVTSSTAGRVGKAMGDPYKGVVTDAKALGRAVYKQAKALGPGDRLGAGAKYNRGKSSVPKLRAHHKTDIYAGMVRQRAAYKKEVQTQYKTFRTISTNVGPTEVKDNKGKVSKVGWIRPATKGVNLADSVSKYIQWVAPGAFQAYAESLVKG